MIPPLLFQDSLHCLNKITKAIIHAEALSIINFVDSFLISYPVLRSEPLATTPLGAIPGLPTTYIIAPDGSPVARQVGPVTRKQLEDYIEKKQKQANPG